MSIEKFGCFILNHYLCAVKSNWFGGTFYIVPNIFIKSLKCYEKDFISGISYSSNIANLRLEDASGVYVGGEQFQFYNYPHGMANSIRARDIPKEEEIVKDQEPIIPDEILYVDVYNAQGQLLMRSTSDNIESLNLPQGIYILRKVGETQSYSIKIIK